MRSCHGGIGHKKREHGYVGRDDSRRLSNGENCNQRKDNPIQPCRTWSKGAGSSHSSRRPRSRPRLPEQSVQNGGHPTPSNGTGRYTTKEEDSNNRIPICRIARRRYAAIAEIGDGIRIDLITAPGCFKAHEESVGDQGDGQCENCMSSRHHCRIPLDQDDRGLRPRVAFMIRCHRLGVMVFRSLATNVFALAIGDRGSWPLSVAARPARWLARNTISVDSHCGLL